MKKLLAPSPRDTFDFVTDEATHAGVQVTHDLIESTKSVLCGIQRINKQPPAQQELFKKMVKKIFGL